jgi:hypothetical protein
MRNGLWTNSDERTDGLAAAATNWNKDEPCSRIRVVIARKVPLTEGGANAERR